MIKKILILISVMILIVMVGCGQEMIEEIPSTTLQSTNRNELFGTHLS